MAATARVTGAPGPGPLRTEAITPERRAVALALVAINSAFLVLDVAVFHATPAALTGRLFVTAALLHAWWLAGRGGSAATPPA